jgi:hypothetical protein
MIEIAASKSFAEEREASVAAARLPHLDDLPPRTERNPGSVLTWLNVVCLDAPIVAVTWHWLFARSFNVSIAPGATAALFLTAWLIYLIDRFVDSICLDPHVPHSLRQDFCLRYRWGWVVAVPLLAIGDLMIVWRTLDAHAVAVGGAIGLCACVYLLINQLRPQLWRLLPLKELAIGFIFAAGTMVGLMRGLTTAALPAWFCFACLCSLNCISIAVWERGLDTAQHRISIATAFPRIGRLLIPALLLLALASVLRGVALLPLCLAGSAVLLALVHLSRAHLQADARTALADLVLLTPLVAVALSYA